MIRRPWLILAPAVLLAAACGNGDTEDTTTSNTSDDAATPSETSTIYTGTGRVSECPDHGPSVSFSLISPDIGGPPACGGSDLVGWSWDDVETYESEGGTTWGTYTVTGTYDGDTFVLTEPPSPPQRRPDDYREPFTPCPEPSGGWAVVDPDNTSREGLSDAHTVANAQPDFAGMWIHDMDNPGMNHPDRIILNVQYTGDLERHEAELREVWGGALCVSEAEHTVAELRAIQDELFDTPGFLASVPDIVDGVVNLEVEVDDGLQERLDEQYGEGMVRVTAALTPVDP